MAAFSLPRDGCRIWNIPSQLAFSYLTLPTHTYSPTHRTFEKARKMANSVRIVRERRTERDSSMHRQRACASRSGAVLEGRVKCLFFFFFFVFSFSLIFPLYVLRGVREDTAVLCSSFPECSFIEALSMLT